MVPGKFAKFLCQFLLNANGYRVRIKPDIVKLLIHALHIMRMRMADGNDCMTPVKIEVFGAVSIIHIMSFGLYRFNIKKGIDLK